MEAVIEVQQFTYAYPRREQPALRNVSFSIQKGQFVAIVGPSGAGKSTLCYSLNGCVPRLFSGEMSGMVKVAGLDTYDYEIPVLAQKVGLVVQNARSQLFNVTVREEVAFGCENLGLPRELIAEKVRQALDFVGLAGYDERAPGALSGGQQQRVAIACVLAMDPSILVLDEPTSELDPIGSEQVMQVIARINRELGKTVFLVTHDMEFVARYADRVLVLTDGTLLEDGTPEQVFAQPDLLKRARIRAPQVSEVAHGLAELGSPLTGIPITVEEAVNLIKGMAV